MVLVITKDLQYSTTTSLKVAINLGYVTYIAVLVELDQQQAELWPVVDSTGTGEDSGAGQVLVQVQVQIR